MKEVFHKVLSVLMAFVVLFTTMSFTVDMHYCGNTLVDFSIIQKAATCGMEKQKKPISCEERKTEKSCCSDEQMIIEGLDYFKISFDKLSFEQQTFITTFFYTYINVFEGLEENIIPFKDYSPPPLIRDVQILHQTFLI